MMYSGTIQARHNTPTELYIRLDTPYRTNVRRENLLRVGLARAPFESGLAPCRSWFCTRALQLSMRAHCMRTCASVPPHITKINLTRSDVRFLQCMAASVRPRARLVRAP